MPSSSPSPSPPPPSRSLPPLSTPDSACRIEPVDADVANAAPSASPRLSAATHGEHTTRSPIEPTACAVPAQAHTTLSTTTDLIAPKVLSSSSVSSADCAITTASRPRRATVSDAPTIIAAVASTSSADSIEMDPINPAGHRRRRSSLMSPSSAAAPQPSRHGHARGPSVSGQFVMDEPKISEESESTIKGKDGVIKPTPDIDFSDEDLHDDEETGLTARDRKRKQKKRRRNTLLDQRIVRDSITEEERKEADQNVVKKLAVNGTLIGLWYLFSLSISLYNKWMFDSNRLNFPFPLFTTSVHMLVQFALSCVVLFFVPSLRPQNAPLRRSDFNHSTRDENDTDRPMMSKMFYLTRIGPCGAATGLDIGLGNTSLKFITLTFYTMCKSSSLAFVLIFAFLFRLEAPTWRLVAIIATMTIGVIMMVAGEIQFDVLGFILVISAAFFSGFRWGLTQILLLRNPATSNPFSSIFFLAPVMFITLLVIAIPVEGFPALIESLKGLMNDWGLAAPLLLLFPGTIAFLMTASEFALLQRTSVVTLSIAGIFKEVVTISTATLVFDDKLTAVNISGLCVTIGAICAYNWIKISKMRQEAQKTVHNRAHIEPDLSSPSSSETDAEDDGGEETGLLARQSIEVPVEQGDLVTVDGDIIVPPPSQATPHTPTSASGEDRDKSQRQD